MTIKRFLHRYLEKCDKRVLNTSRKKLCKHFENHDYVAYKFTKHYPEYQEFVKYFITSSKYAYSWAVDIGNQNFMKLIIEKDGSKYWIDKWNCKFQNDQI